MEFYFTNEMSPRRVNHTLDVLRRPRQWIDSLTDYPDYNDWLESLEWRLLNGQMQGMLSYFMSRPSGAIVYRPDLNNAYNIRGRNISIAPEARGRYVAAFMIRNLALQIAEDYPSARMLTFDTKATNIGMVAFLKKQGYVPIETKYLYGKDRGLDVVLAKKLPKRNNE